MMKSIILTLNLAQIGIILSQNCDIPIEDFNVIATKSENGTTKLRCAHKSQRLVEAICTEDKKEPPFCGYRENK